YAAAGQLKPSAGTLGAWIALTAFCLGLYFDFSGYTDMARGLARLFGFSLPQNFDHPYAARSVGDFFRRWHASFGSWLFTYVYLPLGGSKHGKARLVLSLFAVWCVSALWHGATVCYLLFGLWFFAISLLEKLCLGGKEIGNFCTLFCVWIGFAFFFCQTPADVAAFFARLFWIGGAPLCAPNDLYHLFRLAPLMLLAFLISRGGFAPLVSRLWRAPALLRFSAAAILFFAGLCELSAGGHQPFLYAGF
ncbi:MAG: hypothetical protein IJU41_00600, partial [Clostridia bacterium]|nr:hypothetical protein [Clostridia bacterium]